MSDEHREVTPPPPPPPPPPPRKQVTVPAPPPPHPPISTGAQSEGSKATKKNLAKDVFADPSSKGLQGTYAPPPPPPPPPPSATSSSKSTQGKRQQQHPQQQGNNPFETSTQSSTSRLPLPPPPPPPPPPSVTSTMTSAQPKQKQSSNPFNPNPTQPSISQPKTQRNPFEEISASSMMSPLEAMRAENEKKHGPKVTLESDPEFYSSGVDNNREDETSSAKGKPNSTDNLIYHKIHFSMSWFVVTVLSHICLFTVLLSMAQYKLSSGVLTAFVLLAALIIVLLVSGWWRIHKKSKKRGVVDDKLVPDDEKDDVPGISMKLFALAAVLEGIAFAVYAAITAATTIDERDHNVYYTHDAIISALRFTSIILLCFHRIVRPSNRADPMRTVLELEVVSVCWDAIDGSTFYQLITDTGEYELESSTKFAATFLLVVWYLSVGVRLAMMFLVHMAPAENLIPNSILRSPLEFSQSPTVDRTMQALRVRVSITISMAVAEFFALGLRVGIWVTVGLSSLQQEMAMKNILFLAFVQSAYTVWKSTDLRDWNRADFLGFKLPSRRTQLEIYRWAFIISYVAIGATFSAMLVPVTSSSLQWIGNVGTDVILSFAFFYYYKFAHVKKSIQDTTSVLGTLTFRRLDGYILFPGKEASVLGALLSINMVCARIPSLYYRAIELDQKSGSIGSYNDAMLLVQLTIIPIFCYGMYWSISLMLFNEEFTASPGNYNAIHDPMIDMVSTAIMTEGSLDVISAAAFMVLAKDQNSLPSTINDLILACALLEIWNACQAFALQAVLSGGNEDSPADLVRWKARLRFFRIPIDVVTFALRMVLWIVYQQNSVSVFLVKNLYNLLHSSALIERAQGISKYPKNTLFTEFVEAREWYGLSQAEWREATRETLAAQARAGRRV